MRKIQCEACAERAPGAICDLPDEALNDFRRVSISSVYKPHQVVFTEGNPSNGLYLVCYGAVKLFHSDRFGHDHILAVVAPRAILGEFALDGERPLSVSAETITETQLCFLPRERLTAFLQNYPETSVRLIDGLSRELARARRKVRDLALKDAESRLAALLVQLTRTSGSSGDSSLKLRYTRRDLAEMIGVSTETVIRLLGKLKAKALIDVKRRDIVIMELDKLTAIACYDEMDT